MNPQILNMKTESFYLEKQKFNQTWIKAVFYFLLILTFFLAIIIFAKKNNVLIASIPFCVVALIFILFGKMELILVINDENISYQFIPFQPRMRSINKKDILHISLDNYNPIADYGGWGIRFGRKGKAYTIDGNFGIQLNIVGNKNILIGTMKPKEVYSILKETGFNPGSNVF